jgi:hypothetical protein
MSTNGAYHEDPAAVPMPVLIPPAPEHALAIQRTPEIVIAEARKAAQALKQIIDSKPNPLVLNGKTYLQFEDWQMLGRFYGVTAKAGTTKFVEFGETRGFEATAQALLVSSNQVISSAEAMCLDDEWKWNDKPLFQLKSMAQTRACAKALRNVLAWVVVLAGYAPTPAEELDGDKPEPAQPAVQPPKRRSSNSALISDAQLNRLFAIARDCQVPKEQVRACVLRYGFADPKLITKDKYQFICAEILGLGN